MTKGAMGACPDWYPLFAAADVLHCAPMELLQYSVWWQDKAHIKATAEHEASKQIAALQQGGYY